MEVVDGVAMSSGEGHVEFALSREGSMLYAPGVVYHFNP